jgi:hypothetical protein
MKRKEGEMRPSKLEAALPELERMLIETAAAQIDGAAAAPAEARARTSSRRSLAGRGAPRLAALGLAAVLLTGTAMAATGVWDPPIGALTGAAPPRPATSPVPAGITDVLGILRREQTDKDRSAEVEATLSRALFADGVRPDSVRYLAPSEAPGEATILFSAENPIGPFEPPERICLYRPAFAETTRELPFCFSRASLLGGHAYMTFETSTRELEEALESNDGARLAECDDDPPPAVCLPATATTVGVVPDGVATVTAHFSGAPTVDVPVHENYFELELNGAEITHIPIGVRYLIMRDAQGNVIQPYRPEP